jgi:uncharacterized membrane protein YcaP (DUF421 family)
MEPVIRALVVYIVLLVVFRISGKRTLNENTNFDLVMLLMISETTQQAMVDNDHSITNAVLLIVTLVGTTVALSLLKLRFPRLDRWIDGSPMIVVEDGKPLKARMQKTRVDEADILSAARSLRGLERLDQIKYAIVERSGEITIVPR